VQLYRYCVSQSSEFCRHNPLCCFSTTVYCCKRIFCYRLSPETFGYPRVFQYAMYSVCLLFFFVIQVKNCLSRLSVTCEILIQNKQVNATLNTEACQKRMWVLVKWRWKQVERTSADKPGPVCVCVWGGGWWSAEVGTNRSCKTLLKVAGTEDRSGSCKIAMQPALLFVKGHSSPHLSHSHTKRSLLQTACGSHHLKLNGIAQSV
jgi:hypothetical protein